MMKVYQEVQLTLTNAREDELIGVARTFCNNFPNWVWHEDRTGLPGRIDDGPSFSVLYKKFDADITPLVHVAKNQQNIFRITNVTPRDISPNNISRDDYNMIAKRFGLDFRTFSKVQSLGISVYIPNPDLGLNQIINGKPARTALERYLAYPLRGHEHDDDPLHEFTCAVFRRNVKLSFEQLKRYLIEDRFLPSRDASELCSKVETGLAVLRVYRGF